MAKKESGKKEKKKKDETSSINGFGSLGSNPSFENRFVNPNTVEVDTVKSKPAVKEEAAAPVKVQEKTPVKSGTQTSENKKSVPEKADTAQENTPGEKRRGRPKKEEGDKKSRRFNLTLYQETYDKVEEEANRRRMSVNSVIGYILFDYFDK